MPYVQKGKWVFHPCQPSYMYMLGVGVNRLAFRRRIKRCEEKKGYS